MPKCIICKAEFKAEYVVLPRSAQRFPREICREYSSSKQRPAVRRQATNNIINYCELAGTIEHLVLNEYRSLYRDCLRIMARYGEPDILTDNERSFLVCHNRITGRELLYHDAMTFGNILSLLDATRREIEKGYPELMDSGYDVFRRLDIYGRDKNDAE